MKFPNSFICATEKFNTFEEHIPAPYFRKSFEFSGKADSAELIITGLGIYELYLNGENITKGYLAPYRSNPQHIVYYDSYEVADKLLQGKNVIGIVLGNGFSSSLTDVWDFDKWPQRSAPSTAFSLEIKQGDQVQTVVSDTDTLTAPSPITFDDYHYGEHYDARLEIPNWNMSDFDDSGWARAKKAPTPCGEARLCEAEPIVMTHTLAPIEITEYNGSYIYDFGVNAAGMFTLKITGERGQRVFMQFFECMIDGKPCLDSCRFQYKPFQEDEYYLKGEGIEQYTPRFTYHGYQYVLVSGITKQQATKDLLTYLVMNSDLKTRGEFWCDDEVVNKIQAATLVSDKANFYYFPTDCPHREKNGWTADAALSAEQTLLNLSPEVSYREWLRNIYKTFTDEGMLPGIIPTTGWGYEWGNGPAWDNVIVYLPYYTYLYRGDKQILKEAATPLMRYLNYILSRFDDRGLIAIGLGDWCQPLICDPNNFETPLAVTDTIMVNDIANKAAFIFEVLGLEPQRQFALSVYNATRRSFREHLIDKDTLVVHGNKQTGQVMALYYGMFEPHEFDKAFKVLLGQIDRANGHFDTGVLGSRVIFNLLADNGYTDLAYNMITRPENPSYGYWIANGATSLHEEFKPDGVLPTSLNHHFWGFVSAWFYTYLAGIRFNPYRHDVSNVDIKPCFVEKLGSVKAHHITPCGKISVQWDRVEGGISLIVRADSHLHGIIALPDGYSFADGGNQKPLASGEYKIV